MHAQEESFTFMNFELYKIGSRSVTISYRSKLTKSDWPPEIDEVPVVERLEVSTAH
jgi:hypothetical protein